MEQGRRLFEEFKDEAEALHDGAREMYKKILAQMLSLTEAPHEAPVDGHKAHCDKARQLVSLTKVLVDANTVKEAAWEFYKGVRDASMWQMPWRRRVAMPRRAARLGCDIRM